MLEKLELYRAELEAQKAELENAIIDVEEAVIAYREQLINEAKADRDAKLAKVASDIDCIDNIIERVKKDADAENQTTEIIEE